MAIFFDVSRICEQLLRSTPTGINRVEFNYAKRLFDDPDRTDVVPVITTPISSGALPNSLANRLLDAVATSCGMKITPEKDAVFLQAKQVLEAPIDLSAPSAKRLSAPPASWRRFARYPLPSMVLSGRRLRQRVLENSGEKNVYVNVSHEQLQYANRFAWTAAAHIPSVFMVHDLIPIDFPEFCSPGADDRHRARLETVIQNAALVLANSETTKQSIQHYLDALHVAPLPIEAIPLGVEDCFLRGASPLSARAAVPYILCVGTIEGRKNLGFLFLIWRRLLARLGDRCPRLVIVGRRGWENQNATAILDRSAALAPYLVEIADISDEGLAALMAGAHLLVAPSSAEGYDLPVVEALSLGLPAIASDIPVHREIASGFADLLDPTDGVAWASLIEAIVAPRSDVRENRRSRLAAYRAPNWNDHLTRAFDRIEEVAKGATLGAVR